MTTFQHLVPPFHLCLLFLVARAQLAILTWFCLSFHPYGLSQGSVSFSQTGSVHFYLFFAVLHLCLSFWMGRCENHGPSRGRVENRICSLRMQRGKKVGEREGWMDEGREGVWGCIWCEALQRRVWESKPTMANLMLRPLVNLKASIRQPVFGRILHPVVFFPPTFAFSHSVFGALLRVQPKNLKELSRSPIVKTFSYAFTWVQFQLLLLKMRCVIFLKISLQAVLEGKYLLCLCDVAKGCGSFAYISKFLSCWYNL